MRVSHQLPPMSPPDEVLYAGKWLRFVKRGRWECVERPNITGIAVLVAVTDDGKLLLVEQFRPPVGANVIELPAGLVGDVAGREDEAMLSAANRELEEETGYRAAHLEVLTSGAASAGMSNEYQTLIRASQLTQVGPGGGDEHEHIIVHAIPLAEAPAWLHAQQAAGKVLDVKVWVGLYFAR